MTPPTPSLSPPARSRLRTLELLDVIDRVLAGRHAAGNPQPEPATPERPVPFSPGSPTGPR